MSSKHQAQFEITKEEVQKNLPDGDQISLEEINLKYYNNFKNSKGILIEEIKKKNSEFKIQYALIQQYLNLNVDGRYNPYIILMILKGKTLQWILESSDNKDASILEYFKAMNFIDYEMGKLVNLLQLPILLDSSYEKEADNLVKLYYSFSNDSKVYKTVIDIGFSDYDAKIIDDTLKKYDFTNSQDLIKLLIKKKQYFDLSVFGFWKLEKLGHSIKN